MRLAKPPKLVTDRLVLRAMRRADAPELARLLDDPRISATTMGIPSPYTKKDALKWIGRQGQALKEGTMVNFVVTLLAGGALAGGVGLSSISGQHRRAELGYWTAAEFWNRGFCTEACRVVLGYAFRVLGLRRVYATHFPRNPASGRVMKKLGMKREGTLRRHVLRRGRYEDLVYYGVLSSEFRRRVRSRTGR